MSLPKHCRWCGVKVQHRVLASNPMPRSRELTRCCGGPCPAASEGGVEVRGSCTAPRGGFLGGIFSNKTTSRYSGGCPLPSQQNLQGAGPREVPWAAFRKGSGPGPGQAGTWGMHFWITSIEFPHLLGGRVPSLASSNHELMQGAPK